MGFVMTDAERSEWMDKLYERYFAAALTGLCGKATPEEIVKEADFIARLSIQATSRYRFDR